MHFYTVLEFSVFLFKNGSGLFWELFVGLLSQLKKIEYNFPYFDISDIFLNPRKRVQTAYEPFCIFKDQFLV